MKRTITAGLTLIVMTGSGLAADLPRATPSMTFVEPAPCSSGADPIWASMCYGGNSYRYPLMLGASADPITTPNASLNSSGILGGGQIGYNLELPIEPLGPYGTSIAVGVKGDFDAASIDC